METTIGESRECSKYIKYKELLFFWGLLLGAVYVSRPAAQTLVKKFKTTRTDKVRIMSRRIERKLIIIAENPRTNKKNWCKS